jgi:hypothetical protein
MIKNSRVLQRAPMLIALLAVLCCQAKDKTQKQPDLGKTIQTILNWGQGGRNAPGAKFELRPGEPLTKDGVVYDIFIPYVSGLPTDQSYALLQWPITHEQASVLYPEVYITSDGRLCSKAGQCRDVGSYVQLAYRPGKGEPYRNAIVSQDGKIGVAMLFVPRPITGADAGCSLEVIRATPTFEAAIIRGKGFPAKAHIGYTSNSAGEIVNASVDTDPDGNFNLVMAPFVTGKNQGIDEITFHSDGCAPKVAYHWGTIKV